MNASRPPLFAALKLFGLVVIGLVVLAIGYAGVVGATYWHVIAV